MLDELDKLGCGEAKMRRRIAQAKPAGLQNVPDFRHNGVIGLVSHVDRKAACLR